MDVYLDLVSSVLRTGTYKPNRTGVDTIASFGQYYEVDLAEGFPLLTTKRMDGFRWNSLIHELLWYFSGEEHIRNLREETGIWDEWSDEDGRLDTAYGRFWRRYPAPPRGLDGEAWPTESTPRYDPDAGTFDQLGFVLDELESNPHSRRLVVSAWHPANAAVSSLPPCHYTFTVNIQGDELNLHLTQRSGDVALGIPFNIAAYAIIAQVLAERTGFELGRFAHTIVDAHIYCGVDERGAWYRSNLPELQSRFETTNDAADLRSIRDWIERSAPEEAGDSVGLDHVPGLLTQLTREPLERPTLAIGDRPIDELTFDDFELQDYDAHPGIRFAVAE